MLSIATCAVVDAGVIIFAAPAMIGIELRLEGCTSFMISLIAIETPNAVEQYSCSLLLLTQCFSL